MCVVSHILSIPPFFWFSLFFSHRIDDGDYKKWG